MYCIVKLCIMFNCNINVVYYTLCYLPDKTNGKCKNKIENVQIADISKSCLNIKKPHRL